MTITEQTMETLKKLGYIDPLAPNDYGPGRRCTRGEKCRTYEQTATWGEGEVGKVNRYAEPYVVDEYENPVVLLCEACESERARRNWEPEQLQFGYDVGKVNSGTKSLTLGRLQEVRQAQHLSCAAVARMAGCSRDTIKNAESPVTEKRVSAEMAMRIADALGVHVDELRGER